ncbi:MAG: hypothetical protein IJM72_04180, partial [Deltaproteobacteria bacterium]|nr:hypothetical protein [Deltaproteobacteria bacterium]
MSVKKRFPLRIRTVFFLALFVLAFLASKPEVRHAVKVWNFSGHAPKAETRFFSIEPSWDQDRLYVLSYRFTYADQLTSASPRIH